MNTKLNICGLSFSISTVYKGNKNWDSVNGFNNFNNHKVTVTNLETKKRISFDFWASILNPEIKEEKEAVNTFRCFISDALSFLDYDDFYDFAQEFGYDLNKKESYKNAQNAFKGCEKALSQCEHIGIDKSKLYDIISILDEN